MEVKKRVDLFIKKFRFQPEAYEVCPKWDYCSCNKCKLHEDYAKLQIHTSDKQTKCKCPKKIRREIATYFKLKNLGLSVKELEGVKLSIQINKQSLLTQGKNLKTPETTQENGSTLYLNPQTPEESSGVDSPDLNTQSSFKSGG